MLKDTTDRREAVLEVVISHYIETAEPIGSRYVAKKLNVSSATVRNVMADLKDLGLISQPHTSAGRIPTDKGYRYYIDYLMRVRRINDHIVNIIREQYNQTMRSFEDVLEKTSHLISSLTRYIGITLFPQSEKVYLDGASHIIEQPEFKDFKKLYNLLRCLEEKANIVNLLRSDLGDSLIIHVGKENRSSYLNECSVITRGYRVKGKPAGRLGVIGPKRMVYEKVIPTIEVLADTLTKILDELEI